jgi:Leucine-rich repeat (LRR) protein
MISIIFDCLDGTSDTRRVSNNIKTLELKGKNIVCIYNLDLLEDLKELDLSDNYIQELYGLPENLEILNISNNRIVDLDKTLLDLKKLQILLASNNSISDITLPCLLLTKVDLSNNSILFLYLKHLKNLFWLDCSDNLLKELTLLPESIRILICKDNYITYFKDLPIKLIVLDCSNNFINKVNLDLSKLKFLFKKKC